MCEPVYQRKECSLVIDIVTDLPPGGIEAFYADVWNDFHRWNEEKDVENTFLGK